MEGQEGVAKTSGGLRTLHALRENITDLTLRVSCRQSGLKVVMAVTLRGQHFRTATQWSIVSKA